MDSKKIDLFIDFDGVIVNSTKRMVEMLNEKYGCNKNWRDIKQYDAKDLFPNCTLEDILEVFASKEFFDELEIMDGFHEVIEKHIDDFNIHIATIGTKENLIYKKAFCEFNFKFPFNFIGIEKNGTGKEKIDMSNGIIIDDHVENLISSNAKQKLIFRNFLETEWNYIEEDSELESDITVWDVDNWDDVEDVLSFILRIKLMED